MLVCFIQRFYWFCTNTTKIHKGTLLINWENNHRIKLRLQNKLHKRKGSSVKGSILRSSAQRKRNNRKFIPSVITQTQTQLRTLRLWECTFPSETINQAVSVFLWQRCSHFARVVSPPTLISPATRLSATVEVLVVVRGCKAAVNAQIIITPRSFPDWLTFCFNRNQTVIMFE